MATSGLPTPSLSRRNGTTINTAAHSRHCSLCVVLGSGRHNPTLVWRHQRVAGEAWRVRATSGVGASEPALPRSLRCDLVLCCCVMSYSVLILSTTVAIPQLCRRSLHRHRHRHRHRHPRGTAPAATAAAAAAVRRLLCCGCGWCLLRLFLKDWLLCCVVMIVVIEPGRAAVPQPIWRSHRHRHLRPHPRCCCFAAVCLMVLCWACPCRLV